MRNEPDLTPGEISDWLKEARRSREWLAEQTGSSTGTVAGWLATGRPRPIPVPTLRLIERLMCDDLLGEPQYTYAEAKVIRRAMTKEGYSSLRDFVKDAVMANARRLLGENPGPSEVIDFPAAKMGGGNAPAVHVLSPEELASSEWLQLLGGIAAGSKISTDVPEEPIRVKKKYPENFYALRVFGHSMEPKVADGATIVVEPWHGKGFPKKGTIVAYSDSHGASLKEFGYRKARRDEDADSMGNVPVLRSINQAYPDVETLEGGRIDGVMVEVL